MAANIGAASQSIHVALCARLLACARLGRLGGGTSRQLQARAGLPSGLSWLPAALLRRPVTVGGSVWPGGGGGHHMTLGGGARDTCAAAAASEGGAACAGNTSSSSKPEVTREESHSWAGGGEQAGARGQQPPAGLLDSCAWPVLSPVWPVSSPSSKVLASHCQFWNRPVLSLQENFAASIFSDYWQSKIPSVAYYVK